MPRLFSYGTLQHEDVQISTFGRKLEGEKDLLIGYEPSLVKIPDPELAKRLHKLHHDNVSKTGDDWSSVQGTVFEVTDAELAKAERSKRNTTTSASPCLWRPGARPGSTFTRTDRG